MKKTKLILSLLLAGCMCNVCAENLKIAVNDKGKIGFLKSDGSVAINYQYASATPFSNGISIVTKSNKYGMIDETGKVILPISYTSISPWNDKLYKIAKGNKYGLVTLDGKIVLAAEYSMICPLNRFGKALIGKGGKKVTSYGTTFMNGTKFGIINAEGETLVPATHYGLLEFAIDGDGKMPYNEGMRLYAVSHLPGDTLLTDCQYMAYRDKGFYYGVLDGTSGKVVMPAGTVKTNYLMKPESGMVRYFTVIKGSTECGYYNIDTQKSFTAATFSGKVDKITMWTHGDFVGDIAPVNGSSWSIINKEGKTLMSGYTSLIKSDVCQLMAAKKDNGTWDVFDYQGNLIAPLCGSFSEIKFPFTQEDRQIFSVKKDAKFGAVDREGNTVIPFDYDWMDQNTFGMVVVANNGKYGATDEHGFQLVPLEFDSVINVSMRGEKDIWVERDTVFYHFNVDKQRTSSKAYSRVYNFDKDGLAMVVPVGVKVENNVMNRALCYVPNADKASLEKADLGRLKTYFGYVINANDEQLILGLFTPYYYDLVVRAILSHGRALTEQESKELLLNISGTNRLYPMTEKIENDQWNY